MPEESSIDDLLDVAEQLTGVDTSSFQTRGLPQKSSAGQQRSRSGTPAVTPKGPVADGKARAVTVMRVEAMLLKVVTAIDRRVVDVMVGASTARERLEARLELAVLRDIRSSFTGYVHGIPQDVAICESLLQAAEDAQIALVDLKGAAAERLHRFAGYLRSLHSTANALGCAPAGVREQIQAYRQRIADEASPGEIVDDMGALFEQLQSALNAKSPRKASSLLDDVVDG